MKKNNFLKSVFVLLLLISLTIPLAAKEAKDTDKKEAKDDEILGFIFNTNSLLFEIESYQGGFGFKKKDIEVFSKICDFRGLLDFLIVNDFNTFELNAGAALEFHMLKGRVSPYWGLFLNSGVTRIRLETDEDNWSNTWTIPVAAGGILGVEFFLLEFLSVFAEYNLEFNMTNTINTISIGGVTETEYTNDFFIDTKLGNSSRIGIVIYFKPVVKIDKKR